ncbi:MAG: HD domain-containing protein [Clostridia bacterium]|nr:HD domain-containing protein [Clostridia bacterium]
MCKHFDEEQLSRLRARVEQAMSPYRFAHTKGVEDMAARLAALYVPEEESMLRAAAILHDVTKERNEEWQRELIAANGISLRPDEMCSPKILHAITAALLIPSEYPDFADETLLRAVRWHTTGHGAMTVPEALLYLADYIEEGRRFGDCVRLRKMFFDAVPENMEMATREQHLWSVMLAALSLTVSNLEVKGACVCLDTLAAREDITKKLSLLKGM